MPEWADEKLTKLVRRVLPPRRPDWGVQVVDNPEEACASFARHFVRVECHWREVVYEPGLHSVTGQDSTVHHPLSLVRTRRGARVGLEICKARAIRRANGGLAEVGGYLVRAIEERQFVFDRSRTHAERLALERVGRDPRRMPPKPAAIRRRWTMLRDLAGRTRYSGDFRVAAAAYERWFPERSVAVFNHFGGEGVPLVVVVDETREGLPALQEYEFQDFLCRLRWDLAEAEQALRQPSPTLAPEDDAALAALGFEEGFVRLGLKTN